MLNVTSSAYLAKHGLPYTPNDPPEWRTPPFP